MAEQRMPSSLDGSKLTYFSIPARGEAIRLTLAVAGITWTDNRVAFSEWDDLKGKTPWGFLPVLELNDGTKIGQQRSILRYIGRLTDLYPADPILALRCDELMDVVDDVGNMVNAVGRGLDQNAKETARAEAVATGDVAKMFSKIDTFIATHGTASGCCVGTGTLTVADFFVAATLGNLCSGFFDGVPTDTLDAYPYIRAVRCAVAVHPKVAAWYAGRGEDLSSFEKAIASPSP